jgi:Mce-associated membrane protein
MRRLLAPQFLALGLTIGILAAGAVAITAWRGASRAADQANLGQTCLGGATAAAQALFSYDYQAFDASVAHGLAFTTGDFTKEYSQTTASLKPVAVQQQAVVRAEVSGAGIIDVAPGRVELLVYVNQYRRNVSITGEKVDQNRVVLTMVPDGTSCKVAKAEAI